MADGELQKDFLPQPVFIFTLKYYFKRKEFLKGPPLQLPYSHIFYVFGNVVQIPTARIKQAACNKKRRNISLSIYNLNPTYSAISNLFYALFLCRIDWVPTSGKKHQSMLNLKLLQLSIPESAV